MPSRASAVCGSSTCTLPRAASRSTCAAWTPARRSTRRRTTTTRWIDAGGSEVVGSAAGEDCGSPPAHRRARRVAWHEGWLTRRTFLKRAGAAGVAVAGGTLWATAPAAARARRYGKAQSPLRHIVVSCQENRSFDHYFGYAPQVQATRFGPPPRLHAAGRGGRRARAVRADRAARASTRRTAGAPCTSSTTAARWTASTRTRSARTGDGDNAIPYYTAKELPFYYSLFGNSGLCANYFCSLLGPTWPNRFYLMSGTSGGITTNGLWGYGIFDSGKLADHPRPARRRRA